MYARTATLLAAALFSVFAAAQTSNPTVTNACSGITLGPNGALNGFVPSPSDAWHQPITSLAVDPSSSNIMSLAQDLGNSYLHPDFGSTTYGYYGIPYTVVDSSLLTPVPVPITLYPGDSDQTLFPIPATLPVEGNPGTCPTDPWDRHAIILDKNTCTLYEMYQAANCNSAWTASGSTVWDMTTVEKRPYGLSSVDAAGLSVFEGLVRYDEILAGTINHALRFTAKYTKANQNNGYFVAPATHAAGTLWGTDNIMGMRIRLRAGFDISGYSKTNQVILTAMKTYGMILADNGSNMFFSGTPDARWDDNDLGALKNIPSSAFDVVKMNTLYDSATAPTGAAPTITSFTASATSITPGTQVTLTPVVANSSYMFIDNAGFTRGPVVVSPTATTTYTLTSRNAFGTSNASVKVTVNGSGKPTLAFNAIAAATYLGGPIQISATSSSPGAITYSVTGGPATISGSTLTLTGAGTVSLLASQVASGNYTATTATTSFVSNPATPTLTLATIPTQSVSSTPIALQATSNSTGQIYYVVMSGPATIPAMSNQLTLTGTGTVTVMATQSATNDFIAGRSTSSFLVNSASTSTTTTLTFPAIAARTYGAAPFSVAATSNSPAAITYAVASGPATLSGSTVTMTGAGTVTLTASQAKSGNYPAAQASTSFTVSPATTLISIGQITNKIYGATPFPVSATSNSPAPITYSIASGPATISGSTVTLTGTGTVLLTAAQVATANYIAGTVTTSFTVSNSTTTLTFTPVASQTSGTSFTAVAVSNSPAAITYAVASGPATISGSKVTVTGAGTVVLSASQPAVTGYAAASATTSFTATAAPTTAKPSATLSVNPIQGLYTGTPVSLIAVSNSTGAITYTVTSGPGTILGNKVTMTGSGLVYINVAQAATTTYAATTIVFRLRFYGVCSTGANPVCTGTVGTPEH